MSGRGRRHPSAHCTSALASSDSRPYGCAYLCRSAIDTLTGDGLDCSSVDDLPPPHLTMELMLAGGGAAYFIILLWSGSSTLPSPKAVCRDSCCKRGLSKNRTSRTMTRSVEMGQQPWAANSTF